MSRYFCLGHFIEILKERYPMVTKRIICFDQRKSVEKTKDNQLQLYPYVIVVVDTQKKRIIDYSKLFEICGGEVDDDDTYKIVITLSEGKNKALRTNKNLQLLDVSPDLKIFITNAKKIIEYFSSQIISNVNRTLLNDMILKKKGCKSKTVNQDDFTDIEFV
jgi:hypothetical protein